MSSLVLSCLFHSLAACTSKAFDASETGIIVLCCCVSLVLSCLDFHCLTLPEAFDASEAGISKALDASEVLYSVVFRSVCLAPNSVPTLRGSYGKFPKQCVQTEGFSR